MARTSGDEKPVAKPAHTSKKPTIEIVPMRVYLGLTVEKIGEVVAFEGFLHMRMVQSQAGTLQRPHKGKDLIR